LWLAAPALLLVACRPVANYDGSQWPLYSGSYAGKAAEHDGTLKVITWNIHFAEGIAAAQHELSQVPELLGADIILLQEMDEAGTETLARELGYNYVYYPASLHTANDKQFGEAILARWPISEPRKVILPYRSPKNDQIRIATGAVVTVEGRPVLTYSAHVETLLLGPRRQLAQAEAVAQDAGQEYPLVVLGGDFNTVTPWSIHALEERYSRHGLERVSRGSGPTFEFAGLELTLDHIFARGLRPLAVGVYRDTQASDHYPLWVEVAW
jgi:endonuclease/exonuclease/phosphatase family metal-dependent hydrolase